MNNETLELKNSHYKLDARLDKVETKVDTAIQRSDERWNQLIREMTLNFKTQSDRTDMLISNFDEKFIETNKRIDEKTSETNRRIDDRIKDNFNQMKAIGAVFIIFCGNWEAVIKIVKGLFSVD